MLLAGLLMFILLCAVLLRSWV